MATAEVRMPQVSMGDTEGVVNEWLKAPGDAVARDEVLATIETAKAVVDVVAPTSGVLTSVLAPEGAEITAGDVIAEITVED